MTQPVAIYYTYDTAQVLDDDGNWVWTDVVTGIALWSVDAEGSGQLALWVPAADVDSAFSATSDVQIAAAHGITLNYSPSGDVLWVTAPGYSFAWEPW
jgi:predicted secreted protein